MVDEVWGKDRPSKPNEKVKVLGNEFTGKKFQEKIDDLRKELEKKKSAGLIVCKHLFPCNSDKLQTVLIYL